MNFLKRYWPLVAAALVVALGATLALTGALPKNHQDKAEGTQSDPNVGTSKYPAPKPANTEPPATNLAAVTNPGAIAALADVNGTCDWVEPGNQPPSLQDDSKGAQTYADMPTNPSTATFKCAIARAQAAGYYVVDNSVECDEPVIQLHDADANKNWKFRTFCMGVSQNSDVTCKVTLVPTDYAGNFLWRDEPSFRHQNTSAEYIRNLSSFAGC